jgi:hypothetical protein
VKPKPDKEEVERKKKIKESKDSASQDKKPEETPSQPAEGQGPSTQTNGQMLAASLSYWLIQNLSLGAPYIS